ncbi:hypothetical protein MG5_00739 [Candida albicans P57072]|nr:hypothetical protein MG5_00739 [Candida albicans P57072]KHC40783.1 putative transcription factor with zinc cluster DNA-binding motif [Candida albicans P76055]
MKLSTVGKIKRTRSKTGCLTCRKRKKKCDENKPKCNSCIHLNKECIWPSKDNIISTDTTTTSKRISKPTATDKNNMTKTNNKTTTLLKKIDTNNEESLIRHNPTTTNTILLRTLNYQQLSSPNQEQYESDNNMVSLDSSITNSSIPKKSNYYLERIAMQQDCVEEDYITPSLSQYIDVDVDVDVDGDGDGESVVNDQSNNSP